VDGRWSFASGCQYAEWLIGGCMVMDGDAPSFITEGIPDVRAVILPAADCKVLDTWNTTGLKGTGSHDFAAMNMFVPDERVLPLGLFFAGPPHETAVRRTPFYDRAAPQIAVVGLGLARRAIDDFVKMASGKTPAIGRSLLSDLHTVHQRVGQAEALLRSADFYLYGTLREVTKAHQAGAPIREADSAALRLASAHSAGCAVKAVDLVFEAAGGDSVYAGNSLERCFRDVHMVTHHMMASPLNIEMVGQFLMSGPLQVRR
jgi:alkylation response protein AidB-like acyl-CoA dehydrogenase